MPRAAAIDDRRVRSAQREVSPPSLVRDFATTMYLVGTLITDAIHAGGGRQGRFGHSLVENPTLRCGVSDHRPYRNTPGSHMSWPRPPGSHITSLYVAREVAEHARLTVSTISPAWWWNRVCGTLSGPAGGSTQPRWVARCPLYDPV